MPSEKKPEEGRKKIVRFDITPQTHVRATQGDRWLFRIPRDKLRPPSFKRLLRLEKYNEYKSSLRELSKIKQFIFPNQGCWIRLYFPCPESWSKKKKRQYHSSPHMNKPDVDNCAKAIFDGLFSEDKHIFHFQISKHWVDFPSGWIEFEVQEPLFPEIVF